MNFKKRFFLALMAFCITISQSAFSLAPNAWNKLNLKIDTIEPVIMEYNDPMNKTVITRKLNPGETYILCSKSFRDFQSKSGMVGTSMYDINIADTAKITFTTIKGNQRCTYTIKIRKVIPDKSTIKITDISKFIPPYGVKIISALCTE